MADQSSNMTLLATSTASGERWALFHIKNVTTNDTVAVATWFNKVKNVANLFAGSVTGNTVPTFTGTTVTIAQASLSGDTVFLLVIGDSA